MTRGLLLGIWDCIGLALGFGLARLAGLSRVEAAMVITLCFILMLWNSAGWVLMDSRLLQYFEDVRPASEEKRTR